MTMFRNCGVGVIQVYPVISPKVGGSGFIPSTGLSYTKDSPQEVSAQSVKISSSHEEGPNPIVMAKPVGATKWHYNQNIHHYYPPFLAVKDSMGSNLSSLS